MAATFGAWEIGAQVASGVPLGQEVMYRDITETQRDRYIRQIAHGLVASIAHHRRELDPELSRQQALERGRRTVHMGRLLLGGPEDLLTKK